MFALLVIVDHTAVNVGIEISGKTSAVAFLCTPGSGVAKQKAYSMFA